MTGINFRWGSISLFTLAGLWPAHADQITLRALMEDVPETSIIEKFLPEFEKETGIKVEFEKVGYGDMHDKLVTQLVSPESYYNLLSVDFLWAGEFPAAGWLVDLKPLVERDGVDVSEFIPSMMDLLGRSDATISSLPMYNYAMGMIYRKDLLDDEALKTAYQTQFGTALRKPETLQEYVQVAKFMKARANVVGAAMQGQRGDPNSMEFSNYLFSAGGAYLGADRSVVLDSPEAVQALTHYVDMIGNAAQQGALSANLDDTMRLMCQGQAFSMITYWWMLPQVGDAEKCPNVAGKLDLSVMPGGHGANGGWGWGIAANTSAESQEAAWSFIKWVQSKKIETARAVEGHAPVATYAYHDAAVTGKYPFYGTALEVAMTAEKSFPVFAYSAQYEDVLGSHVSMAADGKTSPKEAIAAAARDLTELMKK